MRLVLVNNYHIYHYGSTVLVFYFFEYHQSDITTVFFVNHIGTKGR